MNLKRKIKTLLRETQWGSCTCTCDGGTGDTTVEWTTFGCHYNSQNSSCDACCNGGKIAGMCTAGQDGTWTDGEGRLEDRSNFRTRR